MAAGPSWRAPRRGDKRGFARTGEWSATFALPERSGGRLPRYPRNHRSRSEPGRRTQSRDSPRASASRRRERDRARAPPLSPHGRSRRRRSNGGPEPGSAADAIVSWGDRERTNGATRGRLDPAVGVRLERSRRPRGRFVRHGWSRWPRDRCAAPASRHSSASRRSVSWGGAALGPKRGGDQWPIGPPHTEANEARYPCHGSVHGTAPAKPRPHVNAWV
jgi:hypothetical protein